MSPTHVYIGPDAVYPQLVYAEGVAPFSCRSGVTAVDFGEAGPPDDGHWQPLAGKKRLAHATPDNAAASAPESVPDEPPATPDATPEGAPDAAAPTADLTTSTAGS